MASTPPPAAVSWLRSNGFLFGLGLAVVVAFLLPDPGAHGGILHADLVNNGGIAVILFLQGLGLAFEKIRSGMGNWKLHTVIQLFTFVVFPVVGLLLDFLVPLVWTTEPVAVRQGFLYLCVLPSTISTSVVLTALAKGNTAGALFNAAFSNILGVVVTPLLVHLLMQSTGHNAPFGPLLLKITLLTLVPFALGMILRPFLKHWIDRNKIWSSRISNAVIIFIVYSAFCDSVKENVWQKYGTVQTLQTLSVVLLLFTGMSLLVWGVCKALKLDRPDTIAAYFCSVKKTLAMGIPLAILIFGESTDLPLILLPIMFYHPVQLFVNGVLANRWSRASA
jgi:sodium/bile acid cotransporter 7